LKISLRKIVVDEDLEFLGWRKVPVDDSVPGYGAKLTLPYVVHGFCRSWQVQRFSKDDFERRLYLVRRVIDHRIRAELKLNRAQYYVPSFSQPAPLSTRVCCSQRRCPHSLKICATKK
jgi:glutamate synthase domain-containing protein 1